jgi:hypothetical protein
MKWPTDGHPSSVAGVMAHPGDVVSITVSCDGRKLVTASSQGHINEWAVSGTALDKSVAQVSGHAHKWEDVVAEDMDIEEAKRWEALLCDAAACHLGEPICAMQLLATL